MSSASAPVRSKRPVANGTNRYAIFLIVIALSAISPAIPHSITPDASWWLAAIGMLVVMVLVGWLGTRLPPRNWLTTLAPLLLFPAIWFLRCADGNGMSGFTPLIFLPVVWFALYGRLRDVVLAIVGGALTVILPMLVIGSPQYPGSSWRGSLLLIIVSAALGPLIYRLVETSRRANRALSRSELEFRAAFEDAPVGMAITGLRGGEAYRFLRVNHALCTMFGRPANELTSVSISELTHPDDIDLTNYRFSVATEPDTPRRVQKRYLHKSGRPIPTSVSYSVVHDEHGVPTHLVSQIEDISGRLESDKALLDAFETDRRATEQMNRLDRMRAEMASTVSHELRTPLTSAAGYVELLVEGDAGPLTDEQRMMLDTVARSLTRLDGIVDDVLNMASVDGPKPTVPDAVADLGTVLHAAVAAVALQAATHGQDLITHDGLDRAEIAADPGRIERVLVNLLTNAMKFSGDDGIITVSATQSDTSATVTVTDTGIGISPEDQLRVFDRFYRADQSSEPATPGSGLGLAIVHAITTQYGGTITVDSEVGKGSTFTLVLPLRVPLRPDAE
jgi:PAS domain S-box-containing protein